MPTEMLCHASSVAFGARGVLIRGAAGSGKSSLCLHLMSLGATLIADDQTQLHRQDGHVWASAPATIAGLIEARGVGILQADHTTAPIVLVIDLDTVENDRLPQRHSVAILGHSLPCFHKVESPAWPAAILQYLKGSRRDPE